MLRIIKQFIIALLFWPRYYEGMSLRPFGADGVDDFLDAAKDHYWDTCEPQKELILKHLEGIADVVRCDGGGKA